MGDKVYFKTRGIEGAKEAFKQLAKIAPAECLAQVETTCIDIDRDAKNNAGDSVDQGQLRASIHWKTQKKILVGIVSADAGHALYVEYGTGPRAKYPPLDPLIGWVHRKLGVPMNKAPGVAFLVARHIKNHGTPAQPFLFPAMEANAPGYVDGLKSRLKKVCGG